MKNIRDVLKENADSPPPNLEEKLLIENPSRMLIKESKKDEFGDFSSNASHSINSSNPSESSREKRKRLRTDHDMFNQTPNLVMKQTQHTNTISSENSCRETKVVGMKKKDKSPYARDRSSSDG